MSKTTVAITLSSTDWEVLDTAVHKVFDTLSNNTAGYDDATVTLLPNEEGTQRRKVVITNPNDKVVAKLARLVVPNTVDIRVVNL